MGAVDSPGGRLRFALPLVHGRGAGLGNEMIAWGKAFVGAQALGLRLLHPAWGLNARGYRHLFRTSRLDWLGHGALRRMLPAFHFTEDDYRSAPEADLYQAITAFGERHGLARRSGLVVCFGGMWGGLRSIDGARQFLRAQLLAARGSCENLYQLERRFALGTVRVGMHIRKGDFAHGTTATDFRNRFNTAIPMPWYVNVARRLSQRLGGQMSLLVVSDGSAQDLAPLTGEFPCILTDGLPRRDISDLLALASCDLIVCSVSSFSMAAAFLSNGRYIWFAPNLNDHGGLVSIWGHEPFQAAPGGETSANLGEVRAALQSGEALLARGVPVGWDGNVPEELIAHLCQQCRLGRASTDLIRYGVIPADAA